METGIYKEVEGFTEATKRCKADAIKVGDRAGASYFDGQLEILGDVRIMLERHGLRYDEHGASGRRDGKGHASAMGGAMEDLMKHSISNATEYRNMDILVDKAKVLVQQLKAAIDEVNNLNNG